MLIIYCPLLLLCYSVAYSWEVKLPMDDQTQAKQTSEDSSDASPEAARGEKVVKSSMLPYRVQDASKSMVSESISSSPSESVNKVNATIRLKFSKESSDETSEEVSFRPASGKASGYKFKGDVLNSNEHATRSHKQEMSSRKIIVYNQTKTQQEDSKVISNNLMQQLNNLHWPAHEETQGIKHYSIREEIQDGGKDALPIIQQKMIIESDGNNVQKEATRSRNDRNEQRKLMEALQILLDNHKSPSVTENPHEQSYNVSDDQVRLLHMLHKLIRNKDITYDFLNRLVLIIYMNGYRDQLLQVLFDIIIEHIEKHGNTEEQQKLIDVLIELWNMLHKLQKGKPGNSLNEHNFSSIESSREKLRVLQLLQLISKLKESNLKNQKGLRSGYLDELRGLYDSSRNKEHLMKVISDYWKKNQVVHKSIPDYTWNSNNSEDNSKTADINVLLQYILQQKDLSNSEKQVLIDNYKNLRSDVLSREDQWKILYDIIKKNKATKKNPNGLIIEQQIYEEIDPSINLVSKTPEHNLKIWENLKQKKPVIDTHVSENESNNKMYQILMQLLKSTEITDKEELRVQIMEILNRMKSNKIDKIIETEPDDGNGDEPMQCKPYSTFKLDKCNKCKCNRDGIPICTFKECKATIKDKENTDLDENLDKYQALRSVICRSEKWPVCAPGTNWRSGCHDCVCDEDGQRHCQKIENCPLLPFGEGGICQPGVMIVKDCKKCKCGDEGRWICVSVC